MNIKINPDDLGTLMICAIRYCHGRQTYMPSLVQDICKPHLKEVTDKALAIILDDCDFQERMYLYGDEKIDKPGWVAWKHCVIAEMEKRNERSMI